MKKVKKVSNSGIVVRPINVNELNQRGQVDLVDFQSLSHGDFRFILNYQEHLTKLIPFKSKTVLQSDRRREFTARIMK